MRAALLPQPNEPLEVIDDLDVAAPRAGEVRVWITHCGLCHSDLYTMDGTFRSPMPMVLGHEAAGEVESVGPGVRHVSPGDKVAITPMPACGRCHPCITGHPTLCDDARNWANGLMPDGTSPFSRRGEIIYRGNGLGGFSEMAVVVANALVKLDDDAPLDLICLIGCAVQTGVGAVLNTAQVPPGATVLIMGLGGIGQSIVQGARIAAAARIIVSDPLAERRDKAITFGATDTIDPGDTDVLGAVRDLTKGIGVDYAFDAAGSADLIATGVRATAPGGAVVMVGAPDPAERLSRVSPAQLIGQEKRLLSTMVGNSYAPRDFPRLIALWHRGLLNLGDMVSSRRPLAEINEGFDDLRAGRGIRTVLTVR
jgi:S-(hydroxymethyl)glutathione dehydrogenase / alcohol dehydrogenase